MRGSTFVPKIIFKRFICLKQMDSMSWTIHVELFMNLTHATKFGFSHEKFDIWPMP